MTFTYFAKYNIEKEVKVLKSCGLAKIFNLLRSLW